MNPYLALSVILSSFLDVYLGHVIVIMSITLSSLIFEWIIASTKTGTRSSVHFPPPPQIQQFKCALIDFPCCVNKAQQCLYVSVSFIKSPLWIFPASPSIQSTEYVYIYRRKSRPSDYISLEKCPKPNVWSFFISISSINENLGITLKRGVGNTAK